MDSFHFNLNGENPYPSLSVSHLIYQLILWNYVWGTLMSSDGRNPPIHIKQRSAGVFHMPETRWNTSVLANMLLRFITSSKCAKQLSTNRRSSFSGKCSCTAARSSQMIRWCSSSHLAYSMSKKAASEKEKEKEKWFNP